MKFCPNCGAPKAAEQDTVCASCGEAYPIVVKPTAPPPVAQSPVAEAPAPAAQAAVTPATEPATPVVADLPTGERVGGAEGVRPTARVIPALPKQESDASELQSSIDKILNAAMSQEDVADLPGEEAPVRKAPLFDYDVEMEAPAPDPQDLFAGAQAPAEPGPAGGLFGGEAPDPAPTEPDLFESPPTVVYEERPATPPPTQQPVDLFADLPPITQEDLFAPKTPAPQAPAGDLFAQEEAAPVEPLREEPAQPIAAFGKPAAEEPPAPLFEAPAAPAQGLGQNTQSFSYAGQPAESQSLFEEQAPARAPAGPRQPRKAAPVQRQPVRSGYTGEPEPEGKWTRLQSGTVQDLYNTRSRERDEDLGIPLPPYEEDAYDEPLKKRRRGPSPVLIVVGILVFVLGVCGITLGLLYYNNTAGKTVTAFVANLGSGETGALKGSVVLNGVANTEGGWQALVDGFESTTDRAALESQLKAMASGTVAEPTYPHITIKKEKLFLFIDRHYIEITGAELLLLNEAGDVTLYLNDEVKQGSPAEGGIAYTGLMPGRYTYVLGRPAEGNTIPATVSVLGAANTLDARSTGFTVTVENCLSDDATLYVNDIAVEQKPVGGVVTLPGVEVDSTIRIVVLQNGQEREASVFFDDPALAHLRFESYTGEDPAEPVEPPTTGSIPATAELNSIMAEYYNSYLTCINNQNMDSIARSTAANNSALTSRIINSDNAPNLFEYVSATVLESSLVENADGTLTFKAEFRYRYTPRAGGDTSDGGNRQTITLVLEDGVWKVNSMVYEAAL